LALSSPYLYSFLSAVAGLVSITPGSGFVPPWAALITGILGAMSCNLFVGFKHMYGFDDALDVFGVHGVGGIVGNLLTGIFASKTIAGLDGSAPIKGSYLSLLWLSANTRLT
jgi:Amt family ammonium transporter